jgi:TetR/AcrR family transcriptional repressor of nem operon
MGRTSDARQRLMDAAYELIWEYSYGSVTIDAICERAAVKKGSFYYFFASKGELALVAIDAWWRERESVLERIFGQDKPPLERLHEYLDYTTGPQIKSYEETGNILGCPIFGLGAEICTQDEKIRMQIETILHTIGSYFEEAIREAQSLGQMEGSDAKQKARILSYYYAGMLTQARIENNVDAVRSLSRDALKVLGAREIPLEAGFLGELSARAEAPGASLAPLR